MQVYVAHSTQFDFLTDLYQPIQSSEAFKNHSIVLPHAVSTDLYNSKAFFDIDCDLVIAEISYPSTGLGIELGWADDRELPIAALAQSGLKVSSSAQAISQRVWYYQTSSQLSNLIDTIIATYV